MPPQKLSSALSSFLREANARWQEEAEIGKTGKIFERLDDGTYICRLTSAELRESQSSKKPQIVIGGTVVDGESVGEKINKYINLQGDTEDKTSRNLQYFARDIATLGYDPLDIIWDPKKDKDENFIVNVLDAIVEEGLVIKVELTTRNDFQQVNIIEVVEDWEDDEEEGDIEPEPEKEPEKKQTKAPEKKGKSSKKPEPEPEPDPEPEEDEDEEDEDEVEVELEVGMVVEFPYKGKTLKGTIKEVVSDDLVKVKSDKLVYPVKTDKLTLLDGETD